MVLHGPNSQSDYGAKHNQNTSAQSQVRANITPSASDVKETPSANEAHEEPDWQTRDNKAQIQMMRAAWVAVGMTGIGLILVGFTLCYTRKAAQSAASTLDESRFASELELQPYLSASEIVVVEHGERLKVYPDTQTIFHGEIEVTNGGKTPVWIRGIECSSVVRAHRHNITDIITPDGKHDEFQYIAAGSSGTIITFLGFRFKSDEVIEFFEIDDLIYSVAVNIRYDDMFSIKRKGNKTFSCEYGIRFEMKEHVDSNGISKLRPCLKLLNSRMLVDISDVHPSKR